MCRPQRCSPVPDDFATVLKQVEEASDAVVHPRAPHMPFACAVFSAGFGAPIKNSFSPRNPSLLFDIDPPEQQQAEQGNEGIVLRMACQSPDAIRMELGLGPELKRADLQRCRRRFAAQNHPDRLPPQFREAAEQRMKTANALLDAAMLLAHA
ncbi:MULTISPECIES: J domain-containing protein [Brucella]|uniref:J domain-containing protein n=1 Tax=Brucella TaxID=234 RepID=UPI0002CFF33F|nr:MULTISPECIES: hypothetical protein [Brucella]AIJ90051.1 hypothetical protein DK63_1642 [Brucella melitensis bv. 1 str. 16M]ARY42750.1 hypothetical protein BK153_00520 [Brucella melitensis]ARY45904.1 hypothetical protein BK154_00520 [Brucella melitensis]ENQ69882.1 hypothetical protein C962_01673 [Brucella melitensis CNGB 1076]ENQ72973.1 hypothetical protein C963_01478 [Brucella melitensis CNGB 1120]